MSSEIRSVIRYMDDYLATGDFRNAIEKGIQSLNSFDAEREYDNSIAILEKLIEISEKNMSKMQTAKFVENMKIRALLSRNSSKLTEIKNKYSDLPNSPIQELLDLDNSDTRKLIMESIEVQNIFGDFIPLPEVPNLRFEDQNNAIKLIEDYYDEGRYVLNLLDITNSLKQTLNIDVGRPEEVNIVDRNHTFKLQ